MSRVSLATRTLRDLRWQVVGYGLGLASMCILIVFIYPSYRRQLADFQIPEALKPLLGGGTYATAPGFLTAEFFSWGPLLGIVFAIMAGTALLGGEEANSTIDLLLSLPISRTRLLLEKLGGFAIASVLLVVLVDVGWVLSVPFVHIDVSLLTLLAATFLMVPQILLVCTFALWLTAVLPDRKLATGVVAAVVVLSFLVNYLAELVDVLKPLSWLSFFHYANSDVLTHGFDVGDLGVQVVATIVFTGAAIRAFGRREIGVHGSTGSGVGLFRFVQSIRLPAGIGSKPART